MKRVGVFGGSFDPVHNAHVALATLALAELRLDEVRWIPVGQPSQKTRKLSPAADREAMVRLALTAEPRFVVDRIELRRRGLSYTLDTVRALNRLYPGARFVWLMGSDILPQLVDWAGWRELFAAIPIAAFARPGWSYAALASAAPRTFARYRIDAGRARALASCQPPAWCFIPSRLDSHSATAIRAVRPRRIKAKGTTISDQGLAERGRKLPDRSQDADALLAQVRHSLDEDKAEDVVVIDLKGKSSFADYMVIASGRSNRQVVAIAEHLADRLKQAGHGYIPVAGKQVGDWVLVDAGDVVVHVFRPEPRAFYGLEKMWALETEAAVKAKPAKTVRPRRVKKPA